MHAVLRERFGQCDEEGPVFVPGHTMANHHHRCVLGCRAVQCKIKLFANVVVEGLWKRVHANDQRAKISIRQEQID